MFKKAEHYEAGHEIDALIHNKIFHKFDAPPPYSSNERVATWLLEYFKLVLMPVREMSSLELDSDSQEINGEVVAFAVHTPLLSEQDDFGFELLSQAESYPLAVARAVLVFKGVTESSWISWAA